MSAPLKPLLALGVAFATGVGVTAAFVGTKPNEGTVQQGMLNVKPRAVETTDMGKVASLAPSSRLVGSPSALEAGSQSSTDRWVDPFKQRSVASPARQPLPPLVFHVDDNQARSSAGVSQKIEQAGKGPARQAVVAMVHPPRRPENLELAAKPAKLENDRRAVVAMSTTDRTLLSRPVTESQSHKSQSPQLTAKLHHRSESVRVASIVEEPDDEDFAAERRARREYAMRQAYYEGMPPQFYPPRRARYAEPYDGEFDDAPPEYKRRAASAAPSGVMRWLEQR